MKRIELLNTNSIIQVVVGGNKVPEQYSFTE